MALSLSIKSLVIIAISIIAIVVGAFLLIQISELKNLKLPQRFSLEEKIILEVTPKSSQQGTVFLITVKTSKLRENQDFYLTLSSETFEKQLILYDDGKHQDEKPSDGVYSGLFDSVNTPIGKYKIKNEKETLSELVIYKSGCEIIEGSSDNNKINFVFLPSNYENFNEFRKDAIKIIKGKNSLLEIEPFSSNIDKFNFIIINTTQDLECKTGCKGFPQSVCCNNNKVMEEASQCDYDNIIVLINNSEICGLSSNYAKICSKNQFSGFILTHELGHTFGDLADEYVYTEVYPEYKKEENKINSPNCDIKGCKKWGNIEEGCFQGCTESNLYRPSENSIMREASYPKFNKVSELQLKKIINNYQSIASKNKKSYFINLRYNKGDINIEKIFLKPIKTTLPLRKTPYTLEIKEKSNIVYKSPLYLPTTEYSIQDLIGIPIQQQEFELPILIPYFEDADSFNILENENVLTKTSLEMFTRTCGNNLCDKSENHISCPKDCNLEDDNFCENSFCDPNCLSQENCETKQKTKSMIAIILIITALIAMFLTLIKSFPIKFV